MITDDQARIKIIGRRMEVHRIPQSLHPVFRRAGMMLCSSSLHKAGSARWALSVSGRSVDEQSMKRVSKS
jgi:hypothetical protein